MLPISVALLFAGMQSRIDTPAPRSALTVYLQAGDLLNGGGFSVFQYWQPPEKRPTPEQARMAEDARSRLLASMTVQERAGAERASDHYSPEDEALAARLNGLNYLQTRQAEVDRFRPCLELLSQGARYPYPIGPTANDPAANPRMLRSVVSLTRLASDASFVAFAEGRTNEGVEILSQALLMANRIGSEDVNCRLASCSWVSFVLRKFSDNLGSISLEDSRKIESLCDSLLEDRDGLRGMIQHERFRTTTSLLTYRVDSSGSATIPGFKNLAILEDQKPIFLDKLLKLVNDRFDSMTQRFDSPEENWLTPNEPQRASNPDPKNLDELAEAVSRTLTSGFDHHLMLAVIRTRTQLRLLRLHARIIGYRWESGRLPTSLDELGLPHEQIYDPLSRTVFKFEAVPGSYKLLSEGIRETGPIELRYQPPSDRSTPDPDRP